MCSIIGCISKQDVSPILVNGLKRMEYRGYDSVGVATNSGIGISVKKGVGKVDYVNETAHLDTLPGRVGIGHTRWATHGGVTSFNAHPHQCTDNSIVVVHNGIIENHLELKSFLQQNGFAFKSETDTEVIPNLISYHYKQSHDIKKSIIDTVHELQGQYGFVAMFDNSTLVAARYHEPLVIGVGKDEYFVSSDVLGFIEKTNDVIYVDNNQFVIMTDLGFHIFDFNGNEVPYTITKISKVLNNTDKGKFAHFTIKEIFDQPYTFLSAVDDSNNQFTEFINILKTSEHPFVTGSGTSYHTALVAKYLFPLFTKISPEPIMSSEMKYSKNRLHNNSVLIAISQSGESADVLEAVSIAKKRGLRVISIVNSVNSSLVRESDAYVALSCGPEVGVAATKSFTSQLAILYKIIEKLKGTNLTKDYEAISKAMSSFLEEEPKIKELSRLLRNSSDVYILGRGVHYPIAKEGALKIKELSYIHAEGFPTGELKHGPLALMDKSTFVIIINPEDDTYQDNLSNIYEVKARGAKVIGISNKYNPSYDYWIKIPKLESDAFYPLVEIIPFQLIAYYAALERGADPDYPRNLAKSVTVK